MKQGPSPVPLTSDHLPQMPGWIVTARAETPDGVAFFSGAALTYLHLLASSPDVPQVLWRARRAVAAAAACARLSGRPEAEEALRDEIHFRRPGDPPGPGGAILLQWDRAVRRPISVAALARALPGQSAERIAAAMDAGEGGPPVARAAAALEAILTEDPRAETDALILSDAALARALGWTQLLPLLATVMTPRDLRHRGDDLQVACHRALVAAARPAAGLAVELSRRAGRLRVVVPKLRAKGAEQAVALIVSSDAIAPAALTGFMSDRAARRLCDRLVALDALRELTGRDSFRLYGV